MATRPVVALLGTFLLAGAAHAAGVPLTLGTSGYLLDAADHPLTQQGVSLRFSVWKDPSSPLPENRVWPATGESECLVDVKNGFYTAIFDGNLASGCGAGLTSEFLPVALARYLQISVGATTLTPRMRIGMVPNAAFATQSGDAQTLIAALAASGTLNAATNPVDWSQLKSVPPGFADGVDLDTTYTAGGGLSLVGNAFSVAAGGVTNAMLENPALTVIAGTGLSGGGSAALGGSTTLSLAAHAHAKTDVTGFDAAAVSAVTVAGLAWTSVTARPTTFPPDSHAHAISEVTGLEAALASKLTAESDPQVGTLTEGKWCTASGGKVECTTNAPIMEGAVMAFGGATCPTGWLKANGQSTASYPALAAQVGANVPDLRGEFVRGVDDARGVDAGRGLRSAQAQDFKSFSMSNAEGPTYAYQHTAVYMEKSGESTGRLFGGAWIAPSGIIRVTWDGSEIRPRNVALLYCIKT